MSPIYPGFHIGLCPHFHPGLCRSVVPTVLVMRLNFDTLALKIQPFMFFPAY